MSASFFVWSAHRRRGGLVDTHRTLLEVRGFVEPTRGRFVHRDGLEVRVRRKCLELRARVRDVPPGLRILPRRDGRGVSGGSVDRASAVVHHPDPAMVKVLLANPHIRGALQVLRGQVDLDAHRLWVRVPLDAPNLDLRIDAAHQLARAVSGAHHRLFAEAAKTLGVSVASPLWLRGVVNGFPISVSPDRVVVVLRRPLPVAVYGVGRVPLALPDPVLDGRLYVRKNPAGVGTRLCHDAVRGPLLELLTEHPHSVVGPVAITVVPTHATTASLVPLVRLAVDLAAALHAVE